MKEQQIRRPHVYELDPLRAVTAFSVVAVHVLAFTVYLNNPDVAGVQIQNAVVTALHFTREVFMFVTAFAMAYVYYGKPFGLKRFWAKRSIGVLLPYSIWSVIYILVNSPGLPPGTFVKTAAVDIVTGTASYQLYYILLTIQFYIILPLFLLFLKKVARHPWKTLSISFVLQVGVLYADYRYLQQGTLASSGFWSLIAQWQNTNVLFYQFYFVLGGFAALYFQQVRSFLLRYGWTIAGAFLAALAGLWLHYVLQIRVYQESIGYATSVLQPIMVFYSLAVILFAFWLACLWAGRKGQDGRPRGYRLWHTLSDASFGVYLIHAFLLTAILKWVVPAMPTLWPVALRVFLTWFMTVASATAITVLLLNIPILSRLVGREHAAKRNAVQAAKEEQQEVHSPQTEKQRPQIEVACNANSANNASQGEQAMSGVKGAV